VHLGLGAFHRAHQAFYTMHARDGQTWGIASFTGRNPDQAKILSAQEGLYTLVERGPSGDRAEIITSVVEAVDGSDIDRLTVLLADSRVAIVTLTITEGGYRVTPEGELDLEDSVIRGDLLALRAVWPDGPLVLAAPSAALTRLLIGLEARRQAASGPIAVVSCDNLPDNGSLTGRAVSALARELDEDLAQWITESVSFVSTSVDRITPRTAETPAVVTAEGWIDHATVVTEPFHDWILSGDFPAGRPAWETAGARFVDDIEPWEQRKLWLLNGAHSILSYRGLQAGHETVAEAMGDPECRGLVESFWAEACALLPTSVDTVEYRKALLERFKNDRIVHRLDQISSESTVKARVRFGAVAERTKESGGDASASLNAIATWIAWVLAGFESPDSRQAELDEALKSSDPIGELLRLISPTLAADVSTLEQVRAAAHSALTKKPKDKP
jgi:fructuronate reductase